MDGFQVGQRYLHFEDPRLDDGEFLIVINSDKSCAFVEWQDEDMLARFGIKQCLAIFFRSLGVAASPLHGLGLCGLLLTLGFVSVSLLIAMCERSGLRENILKRNFYLAIADIHRGEQGGQV